MNKLTFATLLVTIFSITLTGCGDEIDDIFNPPLDTELTFEINGVAKDLTSGIQFGISTDDDFLFRGSDETAGELLDLTLPNDATGTFTDESNGYGMVWYDWSGSDTLVYLHFPSVAQSGFTITVDKFDNELVGEISGTFSGVLYSVLDFSDSVVITNGRFARPFAGPVEVN